jgi:hypothetical protein
MEEDYTKLVFKILQPTRDCRLAQAELPCGDDDGPQIGDDNERFNIGNVHRVA